jgi:hypothetical protein
VPHVTAWSLLNAGDFDPDPGLPASQISTTGNLLPSFPLATRGSESTVFICYVTPDRPANPLAADAIDLWPNPVFNGLYDTAPGGLFFNLNQFGPPVPTIDTNSAGVIATIGNPRPPLGYPTNNLPTWSAYGGGQPVNSNTVFAQNTIFITDSTKTLVFACMQSGTTGGAEPLWNTASVGSLTTDNTVTWVYMGPSFYVAPFYTRPPSWSDPFIGQGHKIYAGTFITDSSRVHIFAASAFHVPGVTGATEPAWNTSMPLAQTTDGTVVWNYTGLNTLGAGQQLLMVIDAIDRN